MQENGIILLNKPTGMTSNTAVNKVKYLLKAKKAGHLGTLDPLGTGVLPITLNKATRLFNYLVKKRKTYRTIFKFGIETDTIDSLGKIINKDNKKIETKKLIEVCKLFVGKIDQIPPAYSAKKINGRKAYELAREGKEVNLSKKQIEVFKIDVIKKLEENVFLLEIECSEGTYIRSLCRDIANSLNTYGIMSSICRTRCGEFDIFDSVTLSDIENNKFKVLDLKDVLCLPCKSISDQEFSSIINGKRTILNLDVIGDFLLIYKNKIVALADLGDNSIVNIKIFLYEGDINE